MGEHYYTNTPTTKTDSQKHRIFVSDFSLDLWTDHGVFSKSGLDFGSRVLIETLVDHSLEVGTILDVGCGYGPIGISLAKLFPSHDLEMIDVNERALALARENCLLNGVPDAKVYLSNVYENVTKTDYSLIVSNPPIRAGKVVVHQIIEESKNYLKEGGQLVIVIQKKQGAPSAEKKMLETFGNVQKLNKEKGYWILASQKMQEA